MSTQFFKDNDLRSENNNNTLYCPSSFIDTEQADGSIIPGTWRNEHSIGVECIRPTTVHRSTVQAYKQRDTIADYFLTPAGEVPWQNEYINRGLNGPDLPIV